ncbi:MAG: 50S ribosomal protein L19 [Chloroflexi bacterium]|nr:MAG: 50S ribosomal protein L19 [Chloroflexota bacterium]
MADKQVYTKPAGRALIDSVENAQLRKDIPEGVVMRLRGGGVNRNFTVRRITHGVGVERTFLINSPRLEKIEVLRHARVRRKQLYFLRGLTGKAARLKELRPTTAKEAAAKEAARAAKTASVANAKTSNGESDNA